MAYHKSSNRGPSFCEYKCNRLWLAYEAQLLFQTQFVLVHLHYNELMAISCSVDLAKTLINWGHNVIN